MITLTAEYALRAIICLAVHPGESMTADAISTLTHVPVGYLSKIMQSLARANLVNSQRGPRGGFALHTLPEQITVFDVIEASAQLPRQLEPHVDANDEELLCGLRRHLESVRAYNEQRQRTTAISMLLYNANNSSGR